MSRPATFKQCDVQRAVKAFMAVGLPVASCEITPEGSILILTASAPKAEAPSDPYEDWKRKRGDRAA